MNEKERIAQLNESIKEKINNEYIIQKQGNDCAIVCKKEKKNLPNKIKNELYNCLDISESPQKYIDHYNISANLFENLSKNRELINSEILPLVNKIINSKNKHTIKETSLTIPPYRGNIGLMSKLSDFIISRKKNRFPDIFQENLRSIYFRLENLKDKCGYISSNGERQLNTDYEKIIRSIYGVLKRNSHKTYIVALTEGNNFLKQFENNNEFFRYYESDNMYNINNIIKKKLADILVIDESMTFKSSLSDNEPIYQLKELLEQENCITVEHEKMYKMTINKLIEDGKNFYKGHSNYSLKIFPINESIVGRDINMDDLLLKKPMTNINDAAFSIIDTMEKYVGAHDLTQDDIHFMYFLMNNNIQTMFYNDKNNILKNGPKIWSQINEPVLSKDYIDKNSLLEIYDIFLNGDSYKNLTNIDEEKHKKIVAIINRNPKRDVEYK